MSHSHQNLKVKDGIDINPMADREQDSTALVLVSLDLVPVKRKVRINESRNQVFEDITHQQTTLYHQINVACKIFQIPGIKCESRYIHDVADRLPMMVFIGPKSHLFDKLVDLADHLDIDFVKHVPKIQRLVPREVIYYVPHEGDLEKVIRFAREAHDYYKKLEEIQDNADEEQFESSLLEESIRYLGRGLAPSQCTIS